MTCDAVGPTAAGFLERTGQVGFGCLHGGDNPEDHGRQDDHDCGESQNRNIKGKLVQTRKARRRSRNKKFKPSPGENHAHDAAQQGKRKTLGDQLPDDSPAARAQRGADGDFGAAGSGPG